MNPLRAFVELLASDGSNQARSLEERELVDHDTETDRWPHLYGITEPVRRQIEHDQRRYRRRRNRR